jgi:hypothetical protein
MMSIDLYRDCFACMPGEPAGRTLFMLAQEWPGLELLPTSFVRLKCMRRTFTENIASAHS